MHTDQQIENLARKVDDLRRDIQATGSASDADTMNSRLNMLERFMDQMKKWQMIIPRAADTAAGGGAVTAADSGVYLNGTTVQLGTNPFIENVILDGVLQAYTFTVTGMDTMAFNDILDFSVGTFNDVSQVDIIGQNGITIGTTAVGNLQIQTPALGAASLNWVLSNIGINGEAEWVNPALLPTNIPNQICDADADTCVETERTADDDTIRFKAANTDMMTATDTNFDIFGVDYLSTRPEATGGTITSFNNSTSPYLGISAAGDNWFDGVDVYVANIVTGLAGAQSAWMTYQDTGANFQHLIRVNASDSVLSSAQGTTNSTIGTNLTQARVQFQNVTNTIQVDVNALGINIDAEDQNLFVNEGTTGTGSGTANPGDVLTLISAATGRSRWQPAPPEPRYEVRQNGNSSTQLTAAGFGQFVAVQYDTEIISSPGFTLGGGGIVTCNTPGDYRVVVQTNMGTLPTGGTVGVFIYRLYINGLPTADQMFQTYERNSEWQQSNVSQDITLVATDTLEYRLIRNGGGRDITSTSSSNRLIIHALA